MNAWVGNILEELCLFFKLRALKPHMYFVNEYRAKAINKFALSNSSHYVPDGSSAKAEMKSNFLHKIHDCPPKRKYLP